MKFEGEQRTFMVYVLLETKDIPKISFQGQERTGEGV